ncbi:sulfotransferase family protein [Lysobacter xanthus]
MKPRVRFLIGGVQKAGTTALARYLSRHPALRLPRDKEAHVFDAPDFDDACSAREVDDRFAAHFDADPDAMHGDATPIYVFHPRLMDRVARYNPDMRWIVLLRDPVERAISQYHMERRRGLERWPMAAAFWLEPLRLAGHRDDFSDASPLRTHSYLRRGRYVDQLDALYARFPASQVLVVSSEDLRHSPADVVTRICSFLGVPPPPVAPHPEHVFSGEYAPPGAFARVSARLLLTRATRRLARRYGIRFKRSREPVTGPP